jgi:hypothetical protein
MEACVSCMGLGHVSDLDCARERFLGRKNRLVNRVHSVRCTKDDGVVQLMEAERGWVGEEENRSTRVLARGAFRLRHA